MTFKSLLPTHLTKELEPYKEAFDFALDPKNKEITNIAVTGNYGAGKSSVISSYFHQKNQHKPTEYVDDCFLRKPIGKKEITISLATFKLRSTDGTDSSDKPNSSSESSQQSDKKNATAIQNIEFNILQQLIHKTHPNQLPKSRFERIIHKHNDNEYVFSTITMVLLLLTFVSIGLISEWKILEKFSILIGFEPNPFFSFIPAFSILGLILLATRYCVHSNLFHKKDMQSIDILKGQVAFKNKDNQSVLNLFLDEILYFFEQTHYDVVIFEDLDRLEHKEIFIRLREINLITNNSEQVQRPIKFIYAIKDDLFHDQETRVKFFDFIIPIIPVMDFDNSYNHLQEEIKRIDINAFHALNEGRLLRDISDRIYDMRLLINIVNEYAIYLAKERINNISDDKTSERSNSTADIIGEPNIIDASNQVHENSNTIDNSIEKTDTTNTNSLSVTHQRLRTIFALVVYKNLMPEDFSLIQSKQSILCKIVDDYRSNQLLKNILDQWKDDYGILKKQIPELSTQTKISSKNLKIEIINKLLLPEIFISQNIYTGPNYHNKTIFDDRAKIHFFDNIIKRDTPISQQTFYLENNTAFSSPQLSANIINSCLDQYDQQEQELIDEFDESLADLNDEVSALNFKINQRYSFAETIRILQEEDHFNEWEKKYYQLELPKHTEMSDSYSDQPNDMRPKYKIKPIIFMLIRRNYINQTYINYISLSHESANELREFRNAISDNMHFEQVFHLSLTENAISKFLREEETILSEHARSLAIVNPYLISYLLKQKHLEGPSSQQNNSFLSYIINFHYSARYFNLKFLTKYIDWSLNQSEYKDYSPYLIQEIFVDTSPFIYIFEDKRSHNFRDLPEEIKKLLLLILISIESNTNIKYEKEIKPLLSSITDFINCFDYLGLHDHAVKNVISWLIATNMQIDLTTPNTDTNSFSYKLFRAVMESSLYKITAQNIIHIFEYDNHSTDALNTMHYSTLCETYNDESEVRKYIEENIVTYVNDILIAKKLSTQEKPENVIRLINNELLDNNQRIEIIKQNTDFIFENNLSEIDFEKIIQRIENNISFGQQLLELDLEYRKRDQSLIQPTWFNLYYLLTGSELIPQKNQAQWLESIYDKVSEITELDDKEKTALKKVVIFNDQLSNDAYAHLVSTLLLKATNDELEELIKLQWEKIQILMDLKLIELSQESTDMIYTTFINPTQEEDDE